MPNQEGRRWLGSSVGILTFLAGIGMLVGVFLWAKEIFQQPPAQALGLEPGKALEINNAGTQLGGIVLRILLLIVMAIIAGIVANRGIRLYGESAHAPVPKEKTE